MPPLQRLTAESRLKHDKRESALADLILVLHFSFIIVVIFGGFLVYIKPRLAWIHIPMVIWSALVNLMGWECPLTPLENWYRGLEGGQVGDLETGFIAHYLVPLIYPEAIDFELGIFLGILVFVWNLIIYALVIFNIRKK